MSPVAPRVASSLLLLLLVVALAADSSSAISGSAADAVGLLNFASGDAAAGLEPSPSRTCRGLVGDCIDEEEEMMMESEISRRGLQRRSGYISYQALFRNKIPCNRRGNSYYNCQKSGARRANPYKRGCTYITRCARILT